VYELVVGTSWLGYELAWYDLVRVPVDRHPTGIWCQYKSVSIIKTIQTPTERLIKPALFNMTFNMVNAFTNAGHRQLDLHVHDDIMS